MPTPNAVRFVLVMIDLLNQIVCDQGSVLLTQFRPRLNLFFDQRFDYLPVLFGQIIDTTDLSGCLNELMPPLIPQRPNAGIVHDTGQLTRPEGINS